MSASCLWLYLLQCDNGSYYAGYTNNLVRRYRQHCQGRAGARYTRAFRPVAIAQCWRLFEPVGTALRIERLLKSQGRPGKEQLVREPARLKGLAEARVARELALFTFNPALVESEAGICAAPPLKRGPDPFAAYPAADF